MARRRSVLAPLLTVPAIAVAAVGNGSAPPAPGHAAADSVYGPLAETLYRIGVPLAHDMGLSGQGVRIGIMDEAFLTSHEVFGGTDVLATRDFVDGGPDVDPGPGEGAGARGTAVWSLTGANAPSRFTGPAFRASFALARSFAGGAPRDDEARWIEALEWLESQGVRIVLTGTGFRSFDDGFSYPPEALDGLTPAPSMAAAQAAERGVLLITPVGDFGPDAASLVVPADADGVGAVGAVATDGSVAEFSSVGPTADGRPKPDLFAPGVSIPSAGVGSPSEILTGDGTALSAALVAGAAALFAEAHPTRSPREIVEALRRSALARPASNGTVGLIDVASAISFPDGVAGIPVEEVDETGQVTTLTPLFRWDAPIIYPAALPVSFTVVLAADTAFADILLAERVVGTFARRLTSPLPPSRRVYWRVDAETIQGATRRSPAAGALDVPPWVELAVLNDPGGSTLQERRPVLSWTVFEDPAPPAGPLEYDVDVFSDRDETPVLSLEGLDTTAVRPPEPLPLNEPLRWRVVARAPAGLADTATSAGPFVVTSSSSPPATILFQNFPNPFPRGGDQETRIWFDLARGSDVSLMVFDLRGRRVRTLIPGPGCAPVFLSAGSYGRERPPDPCVGTRWNGTDDAGRDVEPGVYLLRLRAAGTESVRRMVYWP